MKKGALRSGLMLGIAAILALAKPAEAEESRRFALDYRDGAGCPGEPELVRQIVKRVPLAVRVTGAPNDVAAHVEIDVSGQRVRGVVDFQRADGATHREVNGADCNEVTRAIALILALAIDPDADTAPLAAEPASVPPPTARPAPNPTGSAGGDVARAPARRDWWFGAGGMAGLTGGVAPSPTLYEGLFVEFGRAPESAFSPSFRLSGLRAHDSVETSAGGADFRFLGARLAACPLHFGATIFAEPCATFDYGRLEGSGYATIHPKQATSTWVGPGAALRAGGSFLEVLTLSVDVGLVAPLARDRFFFGPDITAHRIPPIAGYGGISLGFRS